MTNITIPCLTCTEYDPNCMQLHGTSYCGIT